MELNIEQLKKFVPNNEGIYILQYNAGYGREITKFHEVKVIDEENILFLKCWDKKHMKKCYTLSLRLDQILKIDVL